MSSIKPPEQWQPSTKQNAEPASEAEAKSLLKAEQPTSTYVRHGTTSIVYVSADGSKGSFHYERDDKGKLVKSVQ